MSFKEIITTYSEKNIRTHKWIVWATASDIMQLIMNFA